jgi:hypothetical protein
MEDRLAPSITQLTLCQVTTDEIDAATKLLDKACQILRGIPDVLPETNNKTTTGDGGGGTSHALIARYDRPVMGLPCCAE